MPGELVDWDLASSTGRRLARPGPALAAEAADAVVAQLRVLAADAEGHVVDYTKLVPSGAQAPVAVVDRNDWIGANVAGLRIMSRPLLSKLEDKQTGRLAGAAGRRVSGVQGGGLLAYLSSKVLGQYEVFGDGDAEAAGGRLLLVAPNIADVDPTALAARMRAAAGTMSRREGASILELLQTPEQRVVVDRLQALMTLLEGHADQVMDAVGPSVVPSVKAIRERFERRRDGGSPLDRVVRRLLGLDLKM